MTKPKRKSSGKATKGGDKVDAGKADGAALLEEYAMRGQHARLEVQIAALTAGGQVAARRLQVVGERTYEDPKGRPYRKVCVCRLDWYQDRSLISDPQHAAGMHFRELWHEAHINGRIVAIYERDHIPGDAPDPARVLHARKEIRTILGKLKSLERKVVIDVAGEDNWAGTPARLSTLRAALTTMARVWKLQGVFG